MGVKISEKQQEFLTSTAKGIIFRAGIRSGKTRIACYKAIINALKGRNQLFVSFTYLNLMSVVLSTMKICLNELGLDESLWEINESKREITIRENKIYLRSADNFDYIRGLEVADIFIDEASYIKGNECFLVCMGRMSQKPDGQYHITTTPKGRNWVFDLESNENVKVIVQKTSDNPFLPPDFVSTTRAQYPSKFQRQELDAEIVSMSGQVIDSQWIKIIPPFTPRTGVRYWDLAVSVKTSADYSVGALCTTLNGRFTICNIIRGKYTYPDLKKLICATAEIDGRNIQIGIEEAGQQKGFIDDLKSLPEMIGYMIKELPPQGDKLARALPWITRAEAQRVDMCDGPFNAEFLRECDDFSADLKHDHDDQIDAVSGAYALLNRPITTMSRRRLY